MRFLLADAGERVSVIGRTASSVTTTVPPLPEETPDPW